MANQAASMVSANKHSGNLSNCSNCLPLEEPVPPEPVEDIIPCPPLITGSALAPPGEGAARGAAGRAACPQPAAAAPRTPRRPPSPMPTPAVRVPVSCPPSRVRPRDDPPPSPLCRRRVNRTPISQPVAGRRRPEDRRRSETRKKSSDRYIADHAQTPHMRRTQTLWARRQPCLPEGPGQLATPQKRTFVSWVATGETASSPPTCNPTPSPTRTRA
jgi:hypothetical protein